MPPHILRLFTKLFLDSLCNALSIKLIFVKKLYCWSGLAKYIIYTNLCELCMAFLRKDCCYCISQTANYRMFLNCEDSACLFSGCKDKLLIKRLDCVDIDYLCINSLCLKCLGCSRDADTQSPVAIIVQSFPSRSSTPFPISNL